MNGSTEEKLQNFRYLTSDERVYNVMKQAKFYGHSGERVKGLIFCSRIDEAKELSSKFNQNGWRTIVLSSSDSEDVRAEAIERLAGVEAEDADQCFCFYGRCRRCATRCDFHGSG